MLLKCCCLHSKCSTGDTIRLLKDTGYLFLRWELIWNWCRAIFPLAEVPTTKFDLKQPGGCIAIGRKAYSSGAPEFTLFSSGVRVACVFVCILSLFYRLSFFLCFPDLYNVLGCRVFDCHFGFSLLSYKEVCCYAWFQTMADRTLKNTFYTESSNVNIGQVVSEIEMWKVNWRADITLLNTRNNFKH